MAEARYYVHYLKEEILELSEKCTHEELVRWCCECALRVLPYYEADSPHDLRPRHAVEGCEAWLDGNMMMWDVRKLAFAAHASARKSRTAEAYAAARACGHAAATTHVPTHAISCSMYAAQAAKSAGTNVRAEREWQHNCLNSIHTGKEKPDNEYVFIKEGKQATYYPNSGMLAEFLRDFENLALNIGDYIEDKNGERYLVKDIVMLNRSRRRKANEWGMLFETSEKASYFNEMFAEGNRKFRVIRNVYEEK